MNPVSSCRHRLDGFQPDNFLAFLALLGLLRSLETVRREWRPRAAWDLNQPPLRPILSLAQPVAAEGVCEAAAAGVNKLAAQHDFGGATDLKLDRATARSLSARAALDHGYFADVCAALVCDAATGQDQTKIEPTPLAYPSVATSNFLKNFLVLSRTELPEKRDRDASYPRNAAACIAQALLAPWQHRDRPVGLRWDPDEAKRHAYQWRAPTKDLPRTQHGANRLAIIGLSTLTCAPASTAGRVRLSAVGGKTDRDGFSMAWPIWKPPASLATIRALLSHPGLYEPGALGYLGVDHIRVSRRISLDRLRNFARAEPLPDQ
jgi:hypothetical protein